MDDTSTVSRVTADDDALIVGLLKSRDGVQTDVVLADGRVFKVLNIAWGYDLADPYAHISTNVSPSPQDTKTFPFDFFFTHEIARVVDPTDGRVLWHVRKAG